MAQVYHWHGYASWEEWEARSEAERDEWTQDTLDHLAMELQWADTPQEERPSHLNFANTPQDRRKVVEAQMEAATPLTVIVAAAGNLRHPSHLRHLQSLARDFSSRTVSVAVLCMYLACMRSDSTLLLARCVHACAVLPRCAATPFEP